jgi:hypothetical protein
MTLSELSTCILATWSPRIGDPTPIGWITVLAYLATSALTARAGAKSHGRSRFFWISLSILMLGLAVNKQLDLQSALTAAGRCLAKAQGWYEDRRAAQVGLIVTVAFAGAMLTLAGTWAMRRQLGETWLALLGLGTLLTFIAIRAASFHHFDRFIGHEVGGVRMNWILELGGIGLIAANAARRLRRPTSRRAS